MTRQPIRLATERGFCGGVRNAGLLFERTLDTHGAPLYVLNELVHNNTVTAEMKTRGAVFVSSLAEVPAGATLLLGAHGVAPEIIEQAQKRNICCIDATCPLVRKLQQQAAGVEPDRDLILFGDADHPEIKGVAGHAGTKKIHFISSVDDIAALPPTLHKAVLLSQTTRNAEDIRAVAALLQKKYPDLEDHAAVCNAVMSRQNAVRQLAEACEVILIAGSPHSSNARRLQEIAVSCGARAFLIDNISQLPVPELTGVARVGVSSGASTPEAAVRKIVDALIALGFPAPEEML